MFTKVTPLGSAPVSESEAAGVPVVVTEKVPAEPVVNVVLFALVMAGAWFTVFTVKLNACDASVPIPLCAVSMRA